MATTDHIVAGGEGAVTWKALTVCATDINVTENITLHDITTTCDFDATTNRLWMRQKPVKGHLSGSFKFFWDRTNDPWPDLGAGSEGPLIIQVYPATTSPVAPARVINMDTAILGDVAITGIGSDGVVEITANFTSQGPAEIVQPTILGASGVGPMPETVAVPPELARPGAGVAVGPRRSAAAEKS